MRYSSNLCKSNYGSAVSSGSLSSAYNPKYAFDDKHDTCWASSQRHGDRRRKAWLGYCFDSPRCISKVVLYQHRLDTAGGEKVAPSAKTLDIDCSDDGSTWHFVQQHTNVPFSGRVEFSLARSIGKYRYWRLMFVEEWMNYQNPTYGAIAYCWAINELQMFESMSNCTMIVCD